MVTHYLNLRLRSVMVAYAFNPGTWRQGKVNCCDFEAILVI